MGLYIDGQKIAMPYINGRKCNAYINGQKVWNSTKRLDNKYSWREACFANNVFVSHAHYRLSYSIDGMNWTRLDDIDHAYGIAYGNNKFIIPSYTKTYYSANGINWMTNNSAPSDSVQDFCFADNKFITVGTYYIYYSTDGINWTKTNTPDALWEAIAYGNGKYVVVSDYERKCAVSTNGINWTVYSLPHFDINDPNNITVIPYNSMVYMFNKFIALSDTYNFYITSTDGINWTRTDITDGINWTRTDIDFHTNKLKVINNELWAFGGTAARYTSNGTNWTTVSLPIYSYDINYGNEKYVAVGSKTSSKTWASCYSFDKKNWL